MVHLIRQSILTSIFVLVALSVASAACTGSSPTWSCTTSSCPKASDLQNCINGATAGDTINLAAGTYTWNTTTEQITINKAINIIGAGKTNTLITQTYNGGSCGVDSNLFHVAITLNCSTTDHVVRISGIDWTFNGTSCGILYNNSSTTAQCTNVRIDNNILTKSGYILVRAGMSHGVMDNNTITGWFDTAGAVINPWDVAAFAYEFGNDGNFYIEDNIVTITTTGCANAGNGALRYAWRYNTIIGVNGQISPLFDQHGNSDGSGGACSWVQDFGSMGGEVYGNIAENNYAAAGANALDARGGKWLFFLNKFTKGAGANDWSTSLTFREECADSRSSGSEEQVSNGQPQHVSSSYVWSNFYGTSEVTAGIGSQLYCSLCGRNVPSVNYDVWNRNASYNGTTQIGIYCGDTLPTACTYGDGAWITSQGNCTSPTGYVGDKATYPSRGDIDGTFYKCTTTGNPGTWTSYYTPYTYPHPLRDEADTSTSTISGCSFSGVSNGGTP